MLLNYSVSLNLIEGDLRGIHLDWYCGAKGCMASNLLEKMQPIEHQHLNIKEQ